MIWCCPSCFDGRALTACPVVTSTASAMRPSCAGRAWPWRQGRTQHCLSLPPPVAPWTSPCPLTWGRSAQQPLALALRSGHPTRSPAWGVSSCRSRPRLRTPRVHAWCLWRRASGRRQPPSALATRPSRRTAGSDRSTKTIATPSAVRRRWLRDLVALAARLAKRKSFQTANVGCHGPWRGVTSTEPCESICNGLKGCNGKRSDTFSSCRAFRLANLNASLIQR